MSDSSKRRSFQRDRNLRKFALLKVDVDMMVRQLNFQNVFIQRMERFKRRLNSIIIIEDTKSTDNLNNKLQSEYDKFNQDYRYFRRRYLKMSRKFKYSNVYDKLNDMHQILRDENDTGEDDAQIVTNSNVENRTARSSSDNSTDCPCEDGVEIIKDIKTKPIDTLPQFLTANLICQLNNEEEMPMIESKIDGSRNSSESSTDPHQTFRCDYKGCQHQTKQLANIWFHQIRHSLDLSKFECDSRECQFYLKKSDNPISAMLELHRSIHQQEMIFEHLLERSIWNSFVTNERQIDGQPRTFSQYKHHLIDRMLSRYKSVRSVPSSNSSNLSKGRIDPRYTIIGDHFPKKYDRNGSTRICRNCVHCSKKRKLRKQTVFYCAECNVSLCVVPCFRDFHFDIK